MTPEQKALKACTDYSRLSGEIKRLSASLGQSLRQCPGVRGELLTPAFIDRPFDSVGFDDVTHLKEAYTPEPNDGDYDRWGSYLTNDQVRHALSVCQHCLDAHEAIQARKAARRSLGAAKRQISLIGRKAITA